MDKKCSICGSDKTFMSKAKWTSRKTGEVTEKRLPHWYWIDGALVCTNCYARLKAREKVKLPENVECERCHSKETRIDKRYGMPAWKKTETGYVCWKCHIIERNTGRVASEQERQKHREDQAGRKADDATKKKMSDYRKILWNTPEMKQVARELNKRKRNVRISKVELRFINTLIDAGVVPASSIIRLPGRPDICVQPNVCIFIDGDYWHAHPAIYSATDLVRNGKKITAETVWKYDESVTSELIRMGYKVLRFWERDLINKPEECLEKVKASLGGAA